MLSEVNDAITRSRGNGGRCVWSLKGSYAETAPASDVPSGPRSTMGRPTTSVVSTSSSTFMSGEIEGTAVSGRKAGVIIDVPGAMAEGYWRMHVRRRQARPTSNSEKLGRGVRGVSCGPMAGFAPSWRDARRRTRADRVVDDALRHASRSVPRSIPDRGHRPVRRRDRRAVRLVGVFHLVRPS